MSRQRLDADALTEAMGGGKPPASLSRERRVRLLAEAADDLLRGEMPEPEAGTFLAAGLKAWLREGGDLARDYWRVSGEKGSHRTAQWVLRQSSSGRRQEIERQVTVEETAGDPEHDD